MVREVHRLRHVPTAEAYASALVQKSVEDGKPCVSEELRRTLLLHCKAPQAELACSALEEVSGISYRRLNSIYGGFGRHIKERLSLDVSTYSPTSTRLLVVSALVEVSRSSSRARWVWRLYPKVCAAIDQLGWTAP